MHHAEPRLVSQDCLLIGSCRDRGRPLPLSKAFHCKSGSCYRACCTAELMLVFRSATVPACVVPAQVGASVTWQLVQPRCMHEAREATFCKRAGQVPAQCAPGGRARQRRCGYSWHAHAARGQMWAPQWQRRLGWAPALSVCHFWTPGCIALPADPREVCQKGGCTFCVSQAREQPYIRSCYLS